MSAGPWPLVAVFLGTDHHPFDRLLTWASALEQSGGFRFFVQHGSTTLPPGMDGAPMLDPAAMAGILDRAGAVVTHAGPGSIMDARDHGHVPIVVPRNPHYGEHVDDHQLRFARFVQRTGMVATAYDADELSTRLRLATLVGPSLGNRPRQAGTLARFEELVEGLVHR